MVFADIYFNNPYIYGNEEIFHGTIHYYLKLMPSSFNRHQFILAKSWLALLGVIQYTLYLLFMKDANKSGVECISFVAWEAKVNCWSPNISVRLNLGETSYSNKPRFKYICHHFIFSLLVALFPLFLQCALCILSEKN